MCYTAHATGNIIPDNGGDNAMLTVHLCVCIRAQNNTKVVDSFD